MRRDGIVNPAVLLGFLALSCCYFGWPLLPHPERYLVGTDGLLDPQSAVWAFAWWPHALLNWLNPLHSRALFAPVGFNLAWAKSVPALAIPFAPVTLLFGPSFSYNLAALLLPALSAWTAFLLLRDITRSIFASIIGGYLYGFSSYVLAHQLGGHVSLTAAFVPPLIALVILRFIKSRLNGWQLIWRLAALFALQSYIDIEVALTATLMLAVGLTLALLLAPSMRPRLTVAIGPIAAALLLAGVLDAPLLYYALFVPRGQSLFPYWSFRADLANLVVPTPVVEIGSKSLASVWERFPGDTYERDSYLGVPSLLIVGLLLRKRPWPGSVRLLLASFAGATIFSFGPSLVVDGHRLIGLPWAFIYHLPLLRSMIPSRLALYATLSVAALVAIWIAASTRTRRRRAALVLLAVAALVPPFWTRMFVQDPPRLTFFSRHLYTTCFPRGETLLVFPFSGWGASTLWQADSNFYFNLIGGGFGLTPSAYANDRVMNALLPSLKPTYPTTGELKALVQRWHVDRVISAAGMPAVFPLTTRSTGHVYPTSKMMHAFGSVERVADVYVSPACGRPPLTAPKHGA